MNMQTDEYYLLLKGDTAGPYTLEQLHDMWMADKLTLDTLFVRPGMSKCQPINLILSKVINPKEDEEKAAAAAKQPEEKPDHSYMFGITCIIIGIVVLIYAFRTLSHRSADPLREHLAGVELQLADIVIHNRNDFAWENAWVYVNGQPPAGYRYQIKNLPANETIKVPLLNLMDTNGAPFAPILMTVQEIWVGDDIQGYRPFSYKKNF